MTDGSNQGRFTSSPMVNRAMGIQRQEQDRRMHDGPVEGRANGTGVINGGRIPHPASSALSTELAADKADASATSRNGSWQDQLSAYLAPDLAQTDAVLKGCLRSTYSEMESLAHLASATGGKRIRPVLTLLSAHSVFALPVFAKQRTPRQVTDDTYRAAAAIELVHAASLVHDDIMDEAEMRRHVPTLSRLRGKNAAILAGDFLFTKAYELALHCSGRFAARRIATAATELCTGELRQQMNVANWKLATREYLSVLDQKTGALFSASCCLGVWSVRAHVSQDLKDIARRLSAFGRHLGTAFQLIDDWLDYWGDEQVGKTLGTDLQQQKPTLPLLHALRSKSHSERKAMIEMLTCEPYSQDKLTQVRKMLDQTNASKFTIAAAERCVNKALACLDCLPESEPRAFLTELARGSVSRVA